MVAAVAFADSACGCRRLIDIKGRPANQFRGRKRVSAAVVAGVSSAGVLPISYFVFERRRQP
jgi:hypothetical protein